MSISRDIVTDRVNQNTPWDVVIIGGGATGLGAAVDAASRGYTTLLLEKSDLAKGTSSRSTKLVHGGVRYLQQGNIKLVREALYERGLLRANAPHMVQDEVFIIPCYSRFSLWFYFFGLKMYDLLAGRLSFGDSRRLSRPETLRRLPTVKRKGLVGGVLYHDGQFDDAALAVDLAKTARKHGAVILNYTKVTGLEKDAAGKVCGVVAQSTLSDEDQDPVSILARAVLNATGVFVDEILSMDVAEHRPMVRPSQGVHLVVPSEFLPGEDALMIPRTSDGRVLFGVPWQGYVLLGTTDTPLDSHSDEPRALEEEISFILNTASKVLEKAPRREHVTSVFAGLRPLAAPKDGQSGTKTKEISRSHKLIVSKSGLITMTGGKWTTYRKMAEEMVDKAAEVGSLPVRTCVTRGLPIYGSTRAAREQEEALRKEFELIGKAELTEEEELRLVVARAVRFEFAQTVEDVLARRSRWLFLDARRAMELAPEVAQIMANELNKDANWIKMQVEAFQELAKGYLLEEQEKT